MSRPATDILSDEVQLGRKPMATILERESQNLRTEEEVRTQRAAWASLVYVLRRGEISPAEFTKLATEAGMSAWVIGKHLAAARQ